MKVIQVMTRNNENFYNLNLNLSSQLVMFLSVLKWKSFGYTVKLYVDDYFKQIFTENGLINLYDEVDDKYFVENNLYEEYNINKKYFWAFSKLFVYLNEKDNFIMSDLDFIPLKDFHDIIDENKNYVYYREIIDEILYPNNDKLKSASDYTFPEWMTWKENPVNTAIVYLADKKLKDLYISEAIRYAQNNNITDNDPYNRNMIFAEQRLLSECAKYLNIDLNSIKSNYETICNPREIHYYCYKIVDAKKNNLDNWVLYLLDKLYQEFNDVYSNVIELPEYAIYKDIINSKGFEYRIPKPLLRTKW